MDYRTLAPAGIALLTLLNGPLACQRQPDAPGDDAAPAAAAPTTPAPENAVEVTIPFTAEFNGSSLGCASDPGAAETAFTDVRFYLHDIEVRTTADGAWIPAAIADVEHWQNGQVALLSLVARPDRCQDHPEAPHAALRLLLPPDTAIDGIRAAVGVPFALNHADPTTLSGPLGQMQMYWSWRAGFRFVRIDGMHGGESFEVHYGSTQCTGETEAIEGCDRPNLARMEVIGDVSGAGVAVNLNQFLNDALLGGGHCTAVADAPACVNAHAALGIEPTAGTSQRPAPAFIAANR